MSRSCSWRTCDSLITKLLQQISACLFCLFLSFGRMQEIFSPSFPCRFNEPGMTAFHVTQHLVRSKVYFSILNFIIGCFYYIIIPTGIFITFLLQTEWILKIILKTTSLYLTLQIHIVIQNTQHRWENTQYKRIAKQIWIKHLYPKR